MRAPSFVAGGLLASCLVLCALPARAEMIGSELLVPSADAQRERVDAFLAREDVQHQFAALGVSAADAANRVASLTGAELQALSSRIDSLPAGAHSNIGALELVLIILLILLLI